MWSISVMLGISICIFAFVHFSSAYKYKTIIQNDEVFDDCPNQPGGVLNVHGFFDFSELNFRLEGEKVILSGNLTTVWDVRPTDIIQVIFYKQFLYNSFAYNKSFRLEESYFTLIGVLGIQLFMQYLFQIFVLLCGTKINIGTNPGCNMLKMQHR